MSSMLLTDYQKRSAENGGFCSPQQVKQALAYENTIVLDTRTFEEIQQDGREVQHVNYKHIPMKTAEGADACPDLLNHTERFIPQDADVDVPILIYCRSGRRAAKAKQILVEKGYLHVLNAGGYSDVMKHLQE